MENNESKGYAITSMVLGIVSLVVCCLPYITVPAALIGLIFGIVSLKGGYGGRGMAIAGIVTSSVAIALGAWWLIAMLGVLSGGTHDDFVGEYFREIFKQIQANS